MRRTVVLLRHAQTPWNVDGRFNSTTDIGLTSLGAAQAAAAAPPLARLAPFAFLRSDARRAAETAAPLAAMVEQQPEVEPRFAELDFGPFEGHHPCEVAADPTFIAWNDGAPTDDDGPEALEAAAERATAALTDALARHAAADTLVIVSHGALLRILLSRVIFALPATTYRRLVMDNARTAVLRFDSEAAPPRLVAMNVAAADVPDLPDA